MVNLLERGRFSGACSPESEGPQQPIEVDQGGDVHCRWTRDIVAHIAGSSIQAARTIATPGSASTTATSLPDRRST